MVISKELAKGSIILFVSLNIFNFLNLVFNFSSARLLGPADYSILATLMSLVFIFSIPNETIHTVISRYTTKFSGEKGKIKKIMSKSLKKFCLLALAGFIVFSFISPFLEKVLSIKSSLLIITGSFIFASFLLPITRGVLQGTKNFKGLGMTYISESSIKLLLAIFLIFLGWGVYGAITGVVIGGFLAFLISFFSLKEILFSEIKKADTKGIYNYSLPTLVSTASIMVFFSMDIILAKVFFAQQTAGQYAAISNLGKAIFLGTWGFGKAMFPITSERHDRKKESKNILEQTLLTVFLISAAVILVYSLFHTQIIGVLYGQEYLGASWLLIYPSVAMAILSLTNVFVLYNLSVNKPKRNYLTVFFVLTQITLLYLFNSSLLEFSIMLITSSVLFFITLAILTLKD